MPAPQRPPSPSPAGPGPAGHTTGSPADSPADQGWPCAWGLPATGTTWQVLTREPLPATLRERLRALVDDFEQVWSRFRPTSLVSRATSGTGEVVLDLPSGSRRLLGLYDVLHRATDGRLDPLIGSDLVALGYDERYSLVVHDGAAHHLGAAGGRAVWGRDASHVGDRLTLARPALVDVGAAGKGTLLDLVGQALREAGVEEYVLDGSGDLLVRSREPVRLGLEDPATALGEGTPRVVGVVTLRKGALCASGTARRAWGPGLHHLLDAVTGLPVAGEGRVVASWAVAADAATADGVATALFLTDPAQLAAAGLVFDFALLRADGTAAVSRRLPGTLFTS